MAHEINGFAFRGEKAWHGLGNRLPDDATIEQWRVAAGLDYTIEQGALHYSTADGRTIVVGDKVAQYRSDNGECLGVVGNGFKTVQPRDVLEFFRDVVSAQGFRLETAGALKGGRIYFGLAQTQREAEIGKGDTHKQYLLLATACDGSMATHAMLTAIRVVCANTLRLAMSNANSQTTVKTKHNTFFDAGNAKQRLGVIDYETTWAEYQNAMALLAQTPINADEAREIFSQLLRPKAAPANVNGADIAIDNGSTFADLLAKGAAPVVQARAIRGLEELYASYVSAPGATPGSAYGVLQGVTHYIDHARGRDTAQRSFSALFSQGADMKERAFETLMARAATIN